MNNENIERQRLADIKALLEYIKEGIENVATQEKTEQLDDISQSTTAILEVLSGIHVGIEGSEERLLEVHSKITEETFKNLEQPLKDLLSNIKDNTANQEDYLKDVIESYEKYEMTINNIEELIRLKEESQNEIYKELKDNVKKIEDGVSEVKELIPKETSYLASLKEINNSIERMIESERLNNDRYKESLDKVATELTTSQELIGETNIALNEIVEIYEKSNGRLHVLDVKIDTLSNILLDNVEETSIGGMDSE